MEIEEIDVENEEFRIKDEITDKLWQDGIKTLSVLTSTCPNREERREKLIRIFEEQHEIMNLECWAYLFDKPGFPKRKKKSK